MICEKNFLFTNLIKIKNKNIKKEKFITDIFEIAYKNKKPFLISMCNEDELQGVNTREDLIEMDIAIQNKIKNKFIKNGVTIFQPKLLG